MGRWIEMAQPKEGGPEKGSLSLPKNPIYPINRPKVVRSATEHNRSKVDSVNWVNWKAREPFPAPDDDPFRHGRSVTGDPKTWTGRIVSLDAWRRLSAWERHGPDGRLFCGICRAWVDSFPDCHGGQT